MALNLAYDFTSLNDLDPFPEGFGFGIINETDNEIIDEPSPTTYFYVLDGKALFSQAVTTPGGKTYRHGVVCSPGILVGSDASLTVLFTNPLDYYNVNQDEFVLELGLGFRGTNHYKSWVGGLLQAHWVTPAWNPKWKMSAVEVDVDVFTEIESQIGDPPFRELNDLTVRVKQNEIKVTFNGVEIIVTGKSFRGGSQAVLWCKCYSVVTGAETSHSVITEFTGQSLRSGRARGIREFPHQKIPSPANNTHYYQVPIRELMDSGKLRQVDPHAWEFTEEVLVTFEGRTQLRATPGAVIVAYGDILPSLEFQACKVKYQ